MMLMLNKMKMFNWFSGRSIKGQLLLLLFSLTAISVVALSILGVTSVLSSGAKTQRITSSAMQKRVEQFLVQAAAATADKNSLIFQHVQQESDDAKAFAANLFDNSGTFAKSGWKFDSHVSRNAAGQYVNPAEDTSSVYIPGMLTLTPQLKQEFELTAYLDNLFPAVLASEPNAQGVYFTGTQGETRYYPNVGLGALVPVDYTPVTDVFFLPGTPEKNPDKKIVWSDLYDDPAGLGLMITAINPVYTKAGEFKGVVDMDVLLNKIASNIESYTPIETSYAFLVDKGGRAVALPNQAYLDILRHAPKKGEFGSDLSKVTGDYGQVLKQMRTGKDGFNEVKLADSSVLEVAYSPIKGTSFSLGIAARQSVLLKVVADLQKQVNHSTQEMVWIRVLPIGLALLAVVWFYGFFYIKRFTEPINKLTAKTAQVATGNFDMEPEVVTIENEIGQLAKSFNNMVADLKTSHSKIETQNKQLLHEQARLQSSIRSLPFGFAIVNLQNEIVFHNSMLANLFGQPIPDELAASRQTLQSVTQKFISALNILDCIRVCQTLRKPMEQNVEVGPRFFRFFFTPIIDVSGAAEQVIGAVLIMEDTTEARAMERSRDEFFSIASHELRTPLTAIRGSTKMILDYYGDDIKDPSLHEMVDDIHDSSVRLTAIVNDFLDMSRLEQGKLAFKIQSFDVTQLIQNVLREFDVSDPQHKLKLEFIPAEHMSNVSGDPDRVRQIIVNLVGNGVKFTDHGSVTVKTTVQSGTMQIAITDTGRGVPIESQHLLFRKFQQASNNILTRDNTRSTGLGLYISRLLAEGMHGRLVLRSTEVGKGSTFVLELPLAKPDHPAQQS